MLMDIMIPPQSHNTVIHGYHSHQTVQRTKTKITRQCNTTGLGRMLYGSTMQELQWSVSHLASESPSYIWCGMNPSGNHHTSAERIPQETITPCPWINRTGHTLRLMAQVFTYLILIFSTHLLIQLSLVKTSSRYLVEIYIGVYERNHSTSTLHTHPHHTMSSRRQCSFPNPIPMNITQPIETESSGLARTRQVHVHVLMCGHTNYTKIINNKGWMRNNRNTKYNKITQSTYIRKYRFYMNPNDATKPYIMNSLNRPKFGSMDSAQILCP